MDDLISRQAVHDLIIETDPYWAEGMTRTIYDGVSKLPSAERRGRWIRTGEDGYCSICNCDMPMYKEDWEWRYLETPYCPNCGARMDGGENG